MYRSANPSHRVIFTVEAVRTMHMRNTLFSIRRFLAGWDRVAKPQAVYTYALCTCRVPSATIAKVDWK